MRRREEKGISRIEYAGKLAAELKATFGKKRTGWEENLAKIIKRAFGLLPKEEGRGRGRGREKRKKEKSKRGWKYQDST